jgi:hypothetical protein
MNKVTLTENSNGLSYGLRASFECPFCGIQLHENVVRLNTSFLTKCWGSECQKQVVVTIGRECDLNTAVEALKVGVG